MSFGTLGVIGGGAVSKWLGRLLALLTTQGALAAEAPASTFLQAETEAGTLFLSVEET